VGVTSSDSIEGEEGSEQLLFRQSAEEQTSEMITTNILTSGGESGKATKATRGRFDSDHLPPELRLGKKTSKTRERSFSSGIEENRISADLNALTKLEANNTQGIDDPKIWVPSIFLSEEELASSLQYLDLRRNACQCLIAEKRGKGHLKSMDMCRRTKEKEAARSEAC